MRDKAPAPPDGVVELLIAEEWGIPPWEVEAAPAIWIERWMLLRRERARAAKRG